MAVKTASAALSSIFTIAPFTGFYPWRQGVLDIDSGYIKSTGSGYWNQQTSWASFTNWTLNQQPVKWTSDQVDLGDVSDFTLKIESDYDGSLFYIIHTSTTGAFAGEERQYTISNGDYNVSAFYGRYVYVTAVTTGTELRSMTITTNKNKTIRTFRDVNSATLAGTSASRTIPMPVPVSKIVDIKIQPQAPTAYAVNLYVSDTATSQVLIPVIKDKSATEPKFALYGIDNDSRDGIVDITMTTMPRQAMISGNLVVID